MMGLLLFVAQVSAGSPAPRVDVLTVFSELCQSTSSLSVIETAAGRLGWLPFTPEPSAPLGKIASFTNATITLRTFRKTVWGRELHALGTQSPTTVKCIVYDFEAKHPIGDEVAIKWAGAEPARRSRPDSVLHSRTWASVRNIRADSIAITFASSPTMAEEMGMRGVGLAAESRVGK